MSIAPPPGLQPQRMALVCEDAPERQAVIHAALDQIGFTMYPAKDSTEAIERMRRDNFEVVIIDEQFQGSTPLANPVLTAMRAMPMSTRRHMFVVLLGREYKTFDNMMAFAKSVNIVVNLNDLPHLPAILVKGINDNNDFYKVLRATLTEVGKR
jgi:CheY-like chemotaxis protein